MAFTLVFTQAGRAALLNAAQTGTEKRTVVSAGVTNTPFTATADITVLPGEFKRIDAVAGAAIAPDQLSLAILGVGTDAYSVTGFGLYLDDGTLLAVYSQTDPLVVKTEFSAAHIQADVQIMDASIVAGDIHFGSMEFLNPPATETVEGVARIATQEEVDEAADDATMVTPKKLAKAIEHNVVIATPEDIEAGTAGKLVDAAGLKAANLGDLFEDLLIGQISFFASTVANEGWISCTETPLLNREEYPKLFAKIGVTYGQGDGVSTFGLPQPEDFLKVMGQGDVIGQITEASAGHIDTRVTVDDGDGQTGTYRSIHSITINEVRLSPSSAAGTAQVPLDRGNIYPKHNVFPLFIFAGFKVQ